MVSKRDTRGGMQPHAEAFGSSNVQTFREKNVRVAIVAEPASAQLGALVAEAYREELQANAARDEARRLLVVAIPRSSARDVVHSDAVVIEPGDQ